jgi:DNA modification methylase
MYLQHNKIYHLNCVEGLPRLAPKSVHCCVSSPPYYALRDYLLEPTKWPAITYTLFGFKVRVKAMSCCLGLEPTPEAYIGHMVYIYRLVREALRDDGTVWVNIGDSYAANQKNRSDEQACRKSKLNGGKASQIACKNKQKKIYPGIKAKDMLGIPWMLAFALRADGWYLRQDIIWHKRNCMPESCNDRCTKNHEYVFLLAKSRKYYFDQLAIATPIAASTANDSRIKNEAFTENRPERNFPGEQPSQGSGMIKPKYLVPNSWNTGAGSHDAIDFAREDGQGRGKSMLEQAPAKSPPVGETLGAFGLNGDSSRIPREGVDTRGGNQGTGDIPAVSKAMSFKRDSHKNGAEPIFGQKSVQHRPDREETVPTGLANKRSVWSLATQGFKEAHFATFPEKLVEDPIKASTSAYGCCADCGSPYRRLTEKELVPGPKAAFNSVADGRDDASDGNDAGSNRMKDGHKPGWHYETQTTGWVKSCKCATEAIKPAVVLDMFSGSGTVAIVCIKLDVDFIVMEQSEKYVKMSEKRVRKEVANLNQHKIFYQKIKTPVTFNKWKPADDKVKKVLTKYKEDLAERLAIAEKWEAELK